MSGFLKRPSGTAISTHCHSSLLCEEAVYVSWLGAESEARLSRYEFGIYHLLAVRHGASYLCLSLPLCKRRISSTS